MVGEELYRYRIAALYSRRKLGEALGLHGRSAENAVYRWERNICPVPLCHFRKLHELLNIPYEKLIP